MGAWDQKLFEELISNKQFAAWVNGDLTVDREHWCNWVKNHPLHTDEFEEAERIVKNLRFRGGDVSKADISYLWAKTSERIAQTKSTSGFQSFMLQLTRVAAILLLPVVLVSCWLAYNQYSLSQNYSKLLENKHDQNITVIAPIGARISVDLPDGSKAWLNSGSELSYPVVFNTAERRVHLSGEAFFKVQKSETPFFVSNSGPEIKVYGTEFNVNSYADEEQVTVALAEGKISLDLNGREEFLVPGQVSIFDKKAKKILIETTSTILYSSWREGKYIFREAPLSTVLRILQRQHRVNIQLKDKELGNYRYNMTINNESLEQILQMLSISAPIKYNYKHREVNPDGSWMPDQVEIRSDQTRIVRN